MVGVNARLCVRIATTCTLILIILARSQRFFLFHDYAIILYRKASFRKDGKQRAGDFGGQGRMKEVLLNQFACTGWQRSNKILESR